MSWTAETNIKGPKGDKGDQGIQGPPGTSGTGTGNVTGPASAVADRIAVYNGTTGTVIKDGGKTIAELGGSAASGITVAPAGNIAATNVQAALVELDNEKVAKAGDTMTGNLLINKSTPSLALQKTASGQSNQIVGYNGANPRWAIFLGDTTAETGSGNTGSDFTLAPYTDAGSPVGSGALVINRATGVTDFKAAPTVNGVPIGGGGTVYMQDTPPVGAPDKSMWLETDTGMLFTRWNDGNSAQWVQSSAGITDPVMRGHLAGLTLSTAGSSATFGIAAGMAVDSTASANLRLNSAYTKTTSAWAVGSGNGALDTGAISAAAWYHVFLIKRPDTGMVDVLVSLSATAPTLPANYTQFRRIGALVTSASLWGKFSQNGDEFLLDTAFISVNAFTGSTTAQTATLAVPTGVKLSALVNVGGATGSGLDGRVLVSSFDKSDEVPGISNINAGISAAPANTQNWVKMQVRTNTAAQIRYRLSNATGTVFIGVEGWIDRRGRDD